MTGLVNSIIHAAVLTPAGPVVQTSLFPDDPQRQIADLEARLRESEAAYDKACDVIDALEAAHRKLLHENRTLQVGLEAARRVSAYCACGIVRR
jgi:hypothetical protein